MDRALWIVSGALLLPASSAWSFGVETHRAISTVALQRAEIRDGVEAYLRDHLGITTSLDESAYLGDESPAVAFARGAVEEDTFPLYVLPNPLNHFYEPLSNQGLTDGTDPLLGVTGIAAPVWAYDDALHPLYSNPFSWTDARSTQLAVILDPLPSELDELFEILGHAAHLLQDSAQPQHTRNDIHLEGTSGESEFERYCAEHYGDSSFSPHSALTALRDREPLPELVPPAEAREDVATTPLPPSFLAFWDTEQYQGQAELDPASLGLAEFSNRYFVTDDTMFVRYDVYWARLPSGGLQRIRFSPQPKTIWYPGGALSRLHGFPYPHPFEGGFLAVRGVGDESLWWQRSGQLIAANRAESVRLSSPGTREPSFAVTPNPFHDQAEIGLVEADYETHAQVLLPKAISYTAALVKYFFRGRIRVEERFDTATRRHRLRITNESSEAIGEGTWFVRPQSDGSYSRVNATGTLDPGEPFELPYSPQASGSCGTITVAYQGVLGDEPEAVVGRRIQNEFLAGEWVGSWGSGRCRGSALIRVDRSNPLDPDERIYDGIWEVNHTHLRGAEVQRAPMVGAFSDYGLNRCEIADEAGSVLGSVSARGDQPVIRSFVNLPATWDCGADAYQLELERVR